MPTITADKISTIAREVLHAAGASEGHARTVGTHLANANLAGHDSHGFIRIIQYVSNIRQGDIDPKAEPEVERDVGAMAQVNGNSTFGQVVAMMASDLAMDKAREHGIGLVAMHNLGHTGRVGTYPERIANEGMAAMMWTGFVGGTAANSVAPFGGRARRLGTNPVSMSFPSPTEGPVLLDFATSVAAEGKLRVYRARGHTLPSEWVLNKEGVPSRDPNDYYEGGALLPMGGLDGGHKGYGLSIMVALFGAVLGSLGHQSTTMDTQKKRLINRGHRPEPVGVHRPRQGAGGQHRRLRQGHPRHGGLQRRALPRRDRSHDPQGEAGRGRLHRTEHLGRGRGAGPRARRRVEGRPAA